jgi:NAD(P)-dependent dehydrogenase (short-subunit alcohol dehydrogenase family)
VASEVDAVAVHADASDRDQMESVFLRTEEEFGGLDGIIVVCGTNRPEPLLERTEKAWSETLNDSLRTAVLAIELGAPKIARAGGGTIAVVASSLGLHGASGQGAYALAKAAVVSLVRTAAVELGPMGIRVNAVAPGMLDTPTGVITQDVLEGRLMAAGENPTGRLTTPSDVAATIVYLSSQLSGNLNGQTLVLDGGLSALQV